MWVIGLGFRIWARVLIAGFVVDAFPAFRVPSWGSRFRVWGPVVHRFVV